MKFIPVASIDPRSEKHGTLVIAISVLTDHDTKEARDYAQAIEDWIVDSVVQGIEALIKAQTDTIVDEEAN